MMSFVKCLLLTSFALSAALAVPAQVPPPLGPPDIPANATPNYLAGSLFINKANENIQTTINEVNRAIDSMSSTSGVRANLSFRISVRAPFMASTTNPQTQNFRYVKIAIDVWYTISGISYRGVPYYNRGLKQDVTIAFECNQWHTGDGSALIKVSASTPVLDEASFPEQALNFFLQNKVTRLVDRKLKEVLSGVGGTATVPIPTLKCNCLSLSPGDPPRFENSAIGFAYVPPLRILEPGKGLTITLKSIKRIHIPIAPEPREEDMTLELLLNHQVITVDVNKIKAGDEQRFNNRYVTIPKPADAGMLVLVANVTPRLPFGETSPTISNSLYFTKGKNFGTGVQKLMVMKPITIAPLAEPGGTRPKPYTVYRAQYELTIEISPNSMGMGI